MRSKNLPISFHVEAVVPLEVERGGEQKCCIEVDFKNKKFRSAKNHCQSSLSKDERVFQTRQFLARSFGKRVGA